MLSIIILVLFLVVLVLIFRKSTTFGFLFIGGILLIWYIANLNKTIEEHYDNGQLKSEMKYSSGKLTSAKFYHENGQLSLEGDYRENMRNGLWTKYDNEGYRLPQLFWFYKNVCHIFIPNSGNFLTKPTNSNFTIKIYFTLSIKC